MKTTLSKAFLSRRVDSGKHHTVGLGTVSEQEQKMTSQSKNLEYVNETNSDTFSFREH